MTADTAARKRYDAAICWTTGRDIPEDACFEFAEWFMYSDIPLESAFDAWWPGRSQVQHNDGTVT